MLRGSGVWALAPPGCLCWALELQRSCTMADPALWPWLPNNLGYVKKEFHCALIYMWQIKASSVGGGWEGVPFCTPSATFRVRSWGILWSRCGLHTRTHVNSPSDHINTLTRCFNLWHLCAILFVKQQEQKRWGRAEELQCLAARWRPLFRSVYSKFTNWLNTSYTLSKSAGFFFRS